MHLCCLLQSCWLRWLLLANAGLGALIFNYIWFITKRHRQANHQLEQGAHSMFRRDTKRWSYFKLLLGSMTISIPRFLFLWTCIFLALLLVR